MVAHLPKCVGQQGAVAFIDADVRRQVTAFRRHPLKQAGGIDISLRAACTCRRRVNGISVRHLLGDQHIAQPLAREGKGLGKGVADDGVLVDLRYPGDLHAVKGNLPVRLVGDQEYRPSEFFLLSVHDLCDLLYSVLAVYHACRIVRRIDQNDSRLVRDQLLEALEIRIERLFVRRRLHDFTVVVVHIPVVLKEVRRKYDDFLARIEDRLERYVQAARRSYSHQDIAASERCAESSVQ